VNFKGSILPVSAYGNLSLRQISDLDILPSGTGLSQSIKNYSSTRVIAYATADINQMI
jgi:hypothetical protein